LRYLPCLILILLPAAVAATQNGTTLFRVVRGRAVTIYP
jgi:hypothetical protein